MMNGVFKVVYHIRTNQWGFFRLISELELELSQENLANLLSNLPTIRKTLTDTAKLSTTKEDEIETSFLRHCQAFSITQKDDSTTAPKLSTQTSEFLDEISLVDEDNTTADEDRLSALLNELKLLILIFLADESNTRDVIQMSALSQEWGNLWSSVPYLHFRDMRRSDLSDAIDNTLRQYLGRKLERFNVHYNLNEPHHKPNIDSWISFVVDARVENLSLPLFKYVLPLNLYTNPFFCELSLNGRLITLEIGISMNWNSFVQLHLRDMRFGVGVMRMC